MSHKLKVQYWPIDDVKPYPNNPRNNDDAVEYVANSIREFSFQQPIVVDSEGTIIAGHTRLKAAKRLGMDTVPVVVADNLTPAQVNAYRLADNKVAEAATWDMEALAVELEGLEVDFDMTEFGFDASEFDFGGLGGEPTEIVEDEVPDDAPSIVQKGDVWQLGRHRLMCGDSSEKECVSLLMGQETAELLLTDPPYGIKADKGFSGADGFNGKGKPIPRRQYKDDWDSYSPSEQAFSLMLEYCKSAIVFGGNFFTDKLPVGNHWLVWNKHNTMPTFSDAELAWTNIQRNSVKIYDVVYNGLIGKEKERYHPTQKPVKLISDIIRDYTKENDLILDLYGGSGTTLIAAEQLGRTCYMMELDPHYCDIIIERWQNLTGETARKV